MRRGFELKYTDEQRDAVAFAYEDRKIRPAQRVHDLAAAGELEWNGKKLEPFDVPLNTIRDLAKKLRKGRQGGIPSQMSGMAAPDAREAMRQRCLNAWDALMRDLERQTSRDASKVDPKRIRELALAGFDIARMPGSADQVPSSARVVKSPEKAWHDAGQGAGKTMGPLLRAAFQDSRGKRTARQVPESAGQVPEDAEKAPVEGA